MKLRYDQRALADIESIYDYIAEHDPAAASRVIALIRKFCEQLVTFPDLSRNTNWPDVRMRSVVRYPYVIYCTVQKSEVVILHVRHTSRDTPEPGDLGR